MPNRIIKESVFESDKIAGLSDFEFRMWVGLITQADDLGRGDARPQIIKGRVFALRERVTLKDIECALQNMAARGCVGLYTVDGKPYYVFPNWAAHQRVRDVKPKYPGPDEKDENVVSPQIAADCRRLPPESNTNPNTNPNTNESVPHTRTKFVKPSVDDVAAYCAERKNGIDPQHFVDYYDRNGWVVGKNTPMKDWKATVRTWEKNEFNNKQTKPSTPASYDIDRAEQRAKTSVPVLKKNERR